jgi:hypothetical protein
MKNLSPNELTTVVGGASKTDQVTQQLTALQASIKDIATASTSGSGSGSGNNMFMMLAMMMMMRPQSTVVAGGGGPPFAVAAGPVINISSRFRHR